MSDAAARIARLERELDKANAHVLELTRELAHTNDLHRTELSVIHARYSNERTTMMQSIGAKVDNLLVKHDETISAIRGLDDRLTVPPNRQLEHGYAIVVEEGANEDQFTMRFIAGQRKYINTCLRRTEGRVWEAFRETGNPIDLRNRFCKAATRRLREIRAEVSWSFIYS